ncbi:MAG: DUF5107 domain-containing protein [Gemmatimonadetes bacterium]|nr:DUF5107 domain-containing protein [Gemmatimonadota bacterium]
MRPSPGRRVRTLAMRTVAFLALATTALGAQAAPRTARVREYRQSFPTYPFSDPNPIPVVGRIYPYFRFDGFSATSEPREWKVVELENDYIRVLILPEIGGKIWAAVEKRTGRPFIYYNHAVKFRDIAMRGPWTSGGIEANYGIIGHTPNVSTPVDYVIRRNADGSVSCITGALDLLTNTSWRLETRLDPDEASFSTTSSWYNGSSLEQPYYTWMTAGIPTRGNLQYVFPGTSFIGHDGEPGEWPINTARGRDVSWYERNDFGPYKSYHVVGGAGDFFGAYWHDQDFGMARVAPRDEKPGQKIWIWGLSRQGMIWEQLLTDSDGQYSELQSGRLFNQSAEGSTFTPFKHRGFTPQVTDRWTERWMPVVGTKGFVVAGAAGALNVTRDGDRLIVALSPAEPIDDSLIVTSGGRRLLARRVVRAPLRLYADTISAPGVALASVTVMLGDDRLLWQGDPRRTALARPTETPRTFDWGSAYGLHLKGKELLRQREYDRAAVLLDSALARDPHYVPALVDRAAIALRAMQYTQALALTRTALSIDTYDGAANFHYGLANLRLGELADARDGFEIASQTVEYRGAAFAELAKLSLAEGDERRAADYADKTLRVDAADLDALALRIVLARRRGPANAVGGRITALEAADPLSQLARYERLLAFRAPDAPARLLAGVRSELPEQQLFQLAAWYAGVGERAQALRVLEGVGEHPEALYWRAALGPAAAAPALITRADALSPRLILPFRPEVIAALEQAVRASASWKPRYYLALGYWHTGRLAQAEQLLTALGDSPDFAPFYAARAALPGRAIDAQLADLARAAALEPGEWRYGKLLTERRLVSGDTSGAVTTARAYFTRIPSSYILGLTLVRAQLAAGRHADADAVLERLAVLPYEGSAEGHALYREAKLMLAIDAMRTRRWDVARGLIAAAREWPERLGAGKPYAENVDERLEDWLAADIQARTGSAAEASVVRARLADWAADRTARPAAFGSEGRILARWMTLAR